jgi:hypothetical protein
VNAWVIFLVVNDYRDHVDSASPVAFLASASSELSWMDSSGYSLTTTVNQLCPKCLVVTTSSDVQEVEHMLCKSQDCSTTALPGSTRSISTLIMSRVSAVASAAAAD